MKPTLLLLAAAFSLAAQNRLEETLRKGIVEEESKQNLNGAIQAYQSVLTQFENDRKTAATALFRMAESYRKLGRDNDAIAAYTRLPHDFPDQTMLVEQSRSHLANIYKLKHEQSSGTIGQALNAGIDTMRAMEAEQARNRYRALMQEEIVLSEERLARIQKEYQLGASDPEAIAGAKTAIIRLKRDLAAFDAGITSPKR